MLWHYQPVKKLGNDNELIYQVHERFIEDSRPGRVYELTEKPTTPRGSSLNALRAELIQMLHDLEKHEVIDRSNIVEFSACHHHVAAR